VQSPAMINTPLRVPHYVQLLVTLAICLGGCENHTPTTRLPAVQVPDELRIATSHDVSCNSSCVTNQDCAIKGGTCRLCNSGGCNSWVP
jgi:hypothetical protein